MADNSKLKLQPLEEITKKLKDLKLPLETVEISRNERQVHGFVYEDIIICKYQLIKQKKYTAKFDAYFFDIPVQIKFIKWGSSIDMGSFWRNKTIKEDFILIVGFWKGEQKLTEEHILFVDHKIYLKNLEFSDGKNYDKILKIEMNLITNLHVDDDRWTEFCSKYRNLWPKVNQIKLRFKRDHKTQKRMQCAIPWANFNHYFIKQFSKFTFTETVSKQNLGVITDDKLHV